MPGAAAVLDPEPLEPEPDPELVEPLEPEVEPELDEEPLLELELEVASLAVLEELRGLSDPPHALSSARASSTGQCPRTRFETINSPQALKLGVHST